MIFANGMIYDSSEQKRILAAMERNINDTILHRPLDTETVIAAFDELSRRLKRGDFSLITQQIQMENLDEMIQTAVRMLRRSSMEYKVKTELGQRFFEPRLTGPPLGFDRVEICPRPLGTLLHIAAGNMDVLPAYSVAEGLLAGNINILKLPSADNGLTLEIFSHLISIEPKLKDYVYIFDTPSSDMDALRKMASLADGITVWGGDEAVAAVRNFAPAGCRIIEWGHKLGFAYISGYENKEAELSALAEHIMVTKQLLCSSCQVIYLDTPHMDDLTDFSKMFLPYLEQAAEKFPVQDVGAIAEMTLRRYSDMLECTLQPPAAAGGKVFQSKQCSLTTASDSALELSYMYGNCIVKRLPEREMLHYLRRSKGYLQTAGLICTPSRRARLTELLIRCGVNRVMRADNMSQSFLGEAHDGEYALRRYTRIVNVSL